MLGAMNFVLQPLNLGNRSVLSYHSRDHASSARAVWSAAFLHHLKETTP